MGDININCIIRVYQIDYEDVDSYTNRLEIQSHDILNERVVLIVEGKKYAVIGSDLIRAVENCMRTK